MDLSVSRECLLLCLFHLSGWFNIFVEGDVCACQPYGCNTCPSSGPCTRENVALGKPASTSSLFDNRDQYNQKSGPACLAVNGNTDTTFRPINQFPNDPACVHTADGDNSPYWEVDLGKKYVIASITVYGRSPNGNWLQSAQVSIDGNLCYSYAADYTPPAIINIPLNSSLTGQKVKINKSQEFVTVCQVQVWVCSNGYYGSECLSTCGNCSNGTCDPSLPSGVCPQGCIAGYQLPYCKEKCKSGFYGANCTNTCGNCSASTCEPSSGVCPQGCVAGYLAPYCKDTCKPGTYGEGCTGTCGNCFETSACNLYNCFSCRNGTYGTAFNETCGKRLEDTPCNIITACTCSAADPDSDHGSASTAGHVAGAIVGSISGCVIGFLLGMILMRFRLRQQKDTQTSTASFLASMHRVDISRPAEDSSASHSVSPDFENATAGHITRVKLQSEESRPARTDSAEYELPIQPASVYDSLKAVRDDNVYTKLKAAKGKGVK